MNTTQWATARGLNRATAYRAIQRAYKLLGHKSIIGSHHHRELPLEVVALADEMRAKVRPWGVSGKVRDAEQLQRQQNALRLEWLEEWSSVEMPWRSKCIVIGAIWFLAGRLYPVEELRELATAAWGVMESMRTEPSAFERWLGDVYGRANE